MYIISQRGFGSKTPFFKSNTSIMDIYGQAILDFYNGDHDATLTLHNSYDEPEEMKVSVFYRTPDDYSDMENLALNMADGKILDVGAGAGTHSMLLQIIEKDITAIDNSKGCIDMMTEFGVKNLLHENFFQHSTQYDTLLLLMNGLGLAGTLQQLPDFLTHCMSLLNEGGQIIADSSDLSYLYEDGEITPPATYKGDIKYRYEYKENMGPWFDWLYVDQDTLLSTCDKLGLDAEVVMEDDYDQYLVRITKKEA